MEKNQGSNSEKTLFARRDSALIIAALAQHSPAGTFAVWQQLQAVGEPAQARTPGLIRRWVARLFARTQNEPRQQAADPAPLRDTHGHVVLMPRTARPLSQSANDAGVPERRRA